MKSDSILKIASFMLFILIWQVSAYYLDSNTLPTCWSVLQQLWFLLIEDDLLHQLSTTLFRVTVSFAIAMLVGSIIGIAMGYYPRINLALDSLLTIGLNVPALVIIILAYLWFGLNDVAAITAVIVNKLPVVIVTLREGTRSIDNKLLQVGTAFKVSSWKRFIHIFIPQLYPYLFAAARNGLSLIWKIVLVVELLGQSNGVGFKLGTFFQYFDITSILAYTIAFAGIILMVESIVLQPLEKRLNRWRA